MRLLPPGDPDPATLRAVAEETIAAHPGLTIVDDAGRERLAADVLAEADAEAQHAADVARALVAYAGAMTEPAA